jgi:6-phosphogluconolactonase
VTGNYRGRRRMTLTYPALDAAGEILWIVAGEDKRDPVAKLLAHDPSVPAGRVAAERMLVLADRAAAG